MLVLVLVMLVVLSLLGVSSIRNSSIELQIAGNHRASTVNFYHAEGAAREAAQKVLNIDDTALLLPATAAAAQPGDPIKLIKDALDGSYKTVDTKNLDTDGSGIIDTDDAFAVSSIDSVTGDDMKLCNIVTLNDISTGSSLALGASRLYDYNAYGYGESRGKAVIKLGLKKRF